MSGSGRQLFIYWRTAREDRDAALRAVREMQQALLGARPDLRAGLFLRSDDAAQPDVTVMETYACPGGVDQTLEDRLNADATRALQPWCRGARHVEAFEPVDALPPPSGAEDAAVDRLRIRPFLAGDEAAVIALWQLCDLTRPWNDPRKDIARKLGVQREGFLVAEIDGAVVACAMAGYDGHRGWVNYLAVHPDHRRRGIASALMKHAEQFLLGAGCPKINLQVRSSNDAVLDFYRGLGYGRDDVVSLGKRLVSDVAAAPLRIQPLDHRDPSTADRIHALLQLAHAQEAELLHGAVATALQRTVADIQSGPAFHLGAVRDEAVLGLLSLGPDDEPGHINISTLVVHPAHQRQGLARQLLSEALRRTDGAALSVAAGASNAPALALYRSFGFVEYRRGVLPPHDLPFVKLRRPGASG